MFLETTDGQAILGYAGLGTTAYGTEPSDWMSAVLRGRNLPLEQSLDILAGASKRELPAHLVYLTPKRRSGHSIVIPALVNNEPRLYTIDILLSEDRKTYDFRWTRHLSRSAPSKQRTPRFGVAGSGGAYLASRKPWRRNLLKILQAYESGQITAQATADHFASLNHEAHRNVSSGTVGPTCIVGWRTVNDGRPHRQGGEQWYVGKERAPSLALVPIIARQFDVAGIASVLMNSLQPGRPPTLNIDEIKEKVSRLPTEPDEKLR